MKKVGIFFGGKSGEHEVSLMSACSVIRAMNTEKYELVKIGITRKGKWLLYDGPIERIEDGSWEEFAQRALSQHPLDYGITMYGESPRALHNRIDFALPILHGPYGEDGTIQGLFEMMDIPYAGCGVLSSAVAMDKIVAKDIFNNVGLKQTKYLRATKESIQNEPQKLVDEIERELYYPIFVKPANMGSSVGLSKVRSGEELLPALQLALKYDRRIIIEQGIDCREIETAVLGNYQAQVGAVGEIISANSEFYDYKAKYFAEGKTRLCIPADLTEETMARVREMAKKAYWAIDGSGFARVDFLMDKKTGELYLNEINTIPGFTKYSMFPLLWKEAGIDYPALIERIIELGYERYYVKNCGKTDHE